MRPIIRIQGLGKYYRIGERPAYGNLRESITNSLSGALRAAKQIISRNGTDATTPKNNHIWALRDISLDVMPGEILGVIGRNGAGKSTLLKILSRITEPTTGRVDLYGRVGSLLEVGTGFHAELTGRENIYMSGAILGMRRAEIQRKFDEIVAFAEVEKFIDTPLKHYSSGMHVRLGFAVAAHLEPEILLVDEVLAVGDAAFQKKCMSKIGNVARDGRTIILVSHNMASIESLCSSCLLISSGCLQAEGEPAEIIMRYMASELRAHDGTRSLTSDQGRRAESKPIMRSVSLHSGDGGPTGVVRMRAPLAVRVDFVAPAPLRPVLNVAFRTIEGMPIFIVGSRLTNEGQDRPANSDGAIICKLDYLPLMPGTYLIDLYFSDLADITRDLDVIREAISLEVVPADVFGTGQLPRVVDGPICWTARWTFISHLADRKGNCISP